MLEADTQVVEFLPQLFVDLVFVDDLLLECIVPLLELRVDLLPFQHELLVLLLGALGFVVLDGKLLSQDFELLVLRLDLLL